MITGSLFLMCSLLILSVFSQSGGNFEIKKSVIAGGGDKSTGGTFEMTGTIGQPVAGTNSTGGDFELRSGFWGGGATASTPASTRFDFTGDGKADISVWRRPLGEWWFLQSEDNQDGAFAFGSPTDIPVPADFTISISS